jgi:hypothetical protein
MPAEAGRLERGVGSRDRRFFAVLACLAAAGTIAGVLLFGHGGGASGANGCVSYDQAGVMGGGTWRFCDAEAVGFCRAHARESKQLAAQCAKLEVKTET